MAHELYRLQRSIYNRPHLITPDSFNIILDYLDSRNQVGTIKADWFEDEDGSTQSQTEKYKDGLGVLCIDGSLTYKPVMTMCGEAGTSYTSLVNQVQEMADAGVSTIVMEVTSGGGEASHVFQCCNDIRSICDEHGIQLIGYADTIAASAAYALISICDEVVANPSSCLGSIGCVVALLDTSKAMEQAGLKRIFITSGESKVPFAEDGTFKKEFLQEIQEDVDRLNEEFAAHVSLYTGLSVDDVKGFEAKCFNAQEALDKGLVNKIMTNREFASYIANKHMGASNA